MSLIGWIILGALSGWIASMVMKTDAKQGLIADIVMGVLGAVIGGYIFNFFGASGVTGLNFYSFFVALVGACVVIWIGNKLFK